MFRTRFLFFLFAVGFSIPAYASPWLLRDDEVAIVGRYDFEVATQEFKDDRKRENFPLNGKYNASTLTPNLRIGLFDKYELEISLPIKQVNYSSDPVILLPLEDPPDTETAFDYYQENILELGRTELGIGDVSLKGRYQLFYGRMAGAAELSFKLPTGYTAPSGTFGDSPKSAQDFIDNAATLATPDNVQDDVTLGDGQVDITPAFLLGLAAPWGTFARLDAGYNFRLSGAGDEVLGAIKIGQVISQKFIIVAGVNMVYAVQKGEVIGISVAAQDPDLPAASYIGTENLDLRSVRLDKDYMQANAGAIWRILPTVELNVSYSGIFWGRNISATNALSVGFGFRTSFSPDSEDEE